MNSKQHERMLVMFHLIGQLAIVRPDSEGFTSYELARGLNCTSATVTSNLMKYGARFAIDFKTTPHRARADGTVQSVKRLWYLREDSMTYEFWSHSAKRSYAMQLSGDSPYEILKVGK